MSTNDGRILKIDRVLDVASDQLDRCTPGGKFILTGTGFGTHEHVPHDIGVYLYGPVDTPLHRILRYECWKDDTIIGFWPMDLRGMQRLFVEVGDGGAIRGAFYPLILIPQPTQSADGTIDGPPRGRGDAAGKLGGVSQRREDAPPAER